MPKIRLHRLSVQLQRISYKLENLGLDIKDTLQDESLYLHSARQMVDVALTRLAKRIRKYHYRSAKGANDNGE